MPTRRTKTGTRKPSKSKTVAAESIASQQVTPEPIDARQTSRVPVCVKLFAPHANKVTVAGTFNDWNPEVTPLYRQSDGTWQLELYLPPGVYEYRFVVDGCWCDDPNAIECVPNPFGSYNAILRVQ